MLVLVLVNIASPNYTRKLCTTNPEQKIFIKSGLNLEDVTICSVNVSIAILEVRKLHLAKWKAAETSLSKMPSSERLRHLGYVPGPSDKPLDEREKISKGNLAKFSPNDTIAAGIPATYDLRNVGGQNFITPIKDQGGCGSCVAFGTVATVEGSIRKQHNNPNLDVDLSEAHLFYCYGRSDGRDCENGWWPSAVSRSISASSFCSRNASI